MLVGYNTNIPYKGKLYHVQTEDNGLRNPVIITLLYYKGTILAAKKMSYAHVSTDPNYKDLVREMMKEQHKAMMKELIAGKHTEQAAGEQAGPQPTDTAAPSASPGGPAAADSTAHEATGETPAPEPAVPDAPKGRISRSLDDVLLDYILKRGE